MPDTDTPPAAPRYTCPCGLVYELLAINRVLPLICAECGGTIHVPTTAKKEVKA